MFKKLQREKDGKIICQNVKGDLKVLSVFF